MAGLACEAGACNYNGCRTCRTSGGVEATASLWCARQRKGGIYTFYDDKQHPSGGNLGAALPNRVADFVIEKPRGLYSPAFAVCARLSSRDHPYEGPFPMWMG